MLPFVESAILSHAARLAPLKPTGRHRSCARELLSSMLLVLESGMAWRHLGRYAASTIDFRTVHRHFVTWSRLGVFKEAYTSLLKLYSRKTKSNDYHCIDSSYVKSIYGRDCVGRNPTDRGRRATKLSAIVNHEGVAVSLVPFPANTSDYKTVDDTLLQTLVSIDKSCAMYADKGYDSRKVRESFRSVGYIDRVSRRGTVSHRVVNRRRIVVERFFSWLDKNRRLLVRYDAFVSNYMSWTWLACCKLVGSRISIT